MKKFHWLILRMLPGPFFGWLGILMLVLLLQFLIKHLPEIVGKGLPLEAIAEMVVYSLAYMVVLAVPMAVMIASLMSFGKLAESNAYMVIKASGVSLAQIMWPSVLVAAILSGGMLYMNNDLLPEANFRLKVLLMDIQRKKPGFQLEPGVFYEGLNGYTILAQRIPPDSSYLGDLLVYDYTNSGSQPTILKAQVGRLEPDGPGLQLALILERGELHRSAGEATDTSAQYEHLSFGKLRIHVDLSGFDFERTDPNDGFRSDRSMRTSEMLYIVDSLKQSMAKERKDIMRSVATLAAAPALSQQGQSQTAAYGARPDDDIAYQLAAMKARQIRSTIDDARRNALWEQQRVAKYMVEVHKKQSLALACIVFMLLGAPLGLRIQRGGFGPSAAIAVGILVFYWVTLALGEKLTDRGYLPAWFGMWIANIIVGLVALWMILSVSLDLRNTPRLITRIRERWTTKAGAVTP